MRVIDVDGTRLALSVWGEPADPPVVLLHGSGPTRSAWDATAPGLARSHRVYAMDMRGYGDSDRPGAHSLERLRDDVTGVMAELTPGRYSVVGHSLGGTVAWLVAQRCPDRVSHLVAVDSAPPRDPFVAELGPRPDPEPPYDWDAMVALVSQLAQPDPAWWAGLTAVTAKTLILAGGPSSHVPQQILADAHAAVPGSRLVEIPVGHDIHRDAPDRFLAEVVPWLTS
ncbi:alpha/beta hydrolase [Actinocatenispora thailandica]|uniref:Alpha/beta hydrolase n=1 Tax=Actinocatenispora thailandica TaxID=227318 RepID=A0A7R7DUH0_9ACTN|nr:alpha/beta hydrolase [Actinocatenispora thailandica]BCJ37991.1 alpha/beta hydrolase [Actinocatenispora thailandica]